MTLPRVSYGGNAAGPLLRGAEQMAHLVLPGMLPAPRTGPQSTPQRVGSRLWQPQFSHDIVRPSPHGADIIQASGSSEVPARVAKGRRIGGIIAGILERMGITHDDPVVQQYWQSISATDSRTFLALPVTSALPNAEFRRTALDLERLLALEVPDEGAPVPLTADELTTLGTNLTEAVTHCFEPIWQAAHRDTHRAVERIAQRAGIALWKAAVEYLAQGLLFHLLFEYYGLRTVKKISVRSKEGFIAFTHNGSLITSPPTSTAWIRVFHYSRMSARQGGSFDAGSYSGQVRADIAVGARLETTRFRSSVLRFLAVIPEGEGELAMFEAIATASVVASQSITRSVRVIPQS
jgi:hypothetical protein